MDWTLFVVHLYQCQSDPKWPSREVNSKPRPLLLPSWYHLSKLLKWYGRVITKVLVLSLNLEEATLDRFGLIQMRPHETFLLVFFSQVHCTLAYYLLFSNIHMSIFTHKKKKIACKHIRGTTFLNMVLS